MSTEKKSDPYHTDEERIAWGSCGLCGYPVGLGGWLVWDATGSTGTFACGSHVRAIRARNPGGSVEEL